MILFTIIQLPGFGEILALFCVIGPACPRQSAISHRIFTLPCNVVVPEHEDGRVEVCVENPLLMSELLKTDQLTELFTTVNNSIDKVLAAM